MKQANVFIVLYVLTLVFQGQQAYRNLVVPGVTIASQSSTYSLYNASRTVDGQPLKLRMSEGSCSHTGFLQTTAWLQIQLDKVYNVKEVKFWYRKEPVDSEVRSTRRLHYYSMSYLDGRSWKQCYRDQTARSQPIPMPSTVSCNSRTESIQFFTREANPQDKPNVFLEICEVEIYGCDVNQYGNECSNCSNGCLECDVVSGCVSCRRQFIGSDCQLCQPGFIGDNCDVSCRSGWYGQNCSMECSTHCLNNATCDTVNGICPQGCSPGYRGSMCTEECSAGTYGTRCEKFCSGNCLESPACNFVNGFCNRGCKSGWAGPRCQFPCTNGTYGENCAHSCSGNCYQSQPCDQFVGTCPDGCTSGWTGPTCEQDGNSTGPSPIAISIGLATTALCICCFLVVFVICYHKRRVSGKGNATGNPNLYEGSLSADVPTANVYELPVKIQTESSVYDELSLGVEYQNEAPREILKM